MVISKYQCLKCILILVTKTKPQARKEDSSDEDSSDEEEKPKAKSGIYSIYKQQFIYNVKILFIWHFRSDNNENLVLRP